MSTIEYRTFIEPESIKSFDATADDGSVLVNLHGVGIQCGYVSKAEVALMLFREEAA